MLTITSYFGFLLAALTITSALFIGLSQQIGIHLSTDFFLPFELISIILLVALIGAIAIARQ